MRELITESNMIKRGFKISGNEREGVPSAIAQWGELNIEYIFGYKYFRIWELGSHWQKEMNYIDEIDSAYKFFTGKDFIL